MNKIELKDLFPGLEDAIDASNEFIKNIKEDVDLGCIGFNEIRDIVDYPEGAGDSIIVEIVQSLKYKGLDDILGDDDYSIYVDSIDTDHKNITITVFINFMDSKELTQDLEKQVTEYFIDYFGNDYNININLKILILI